MSINIDVVGVTSYVLPNMDKIRVRLDTAYNDCKNLYNSLPNNFSYKTTINELCSNLYNYKNDYNNSLKIINSKISTVENIENKTEQRVSDITSDLNTITTTPKVSETVKEEKVSFFGEFKDNWLTGIDMIFGGGKKDKITFEEFLATSTNALIGFTEGMLDVVENIGDAALSIGGTVVAGYASFVDLCRGDLDATCYNAVMDWTKATVANDWTNELHDFYYEDYGAILDECSADIMDSDSSGFQVAKQTGTMAGTIILATTGTPVSAGTSAAASQAANMAVVGATNSFGYNTGNEWNKNSVTISYDGVNTMDLNIDYDTYSRLENLKPGESLNVSQSYVLEDGTTQNVTYTFSKNADGNLSASDSFGNIVNTHSIEESNTYKAMLKSSVKAAWDGAQYYVGGKIAGAQFSNITGNISNSYLQVAAQSGMRIGLDTLTGAVEVPVQAGIDAIFDDISYKEAWNNQGGIKAMLTQTAIAAGSSLVGEGFAYTENVKANQLTSILQTGNSHLITSSLDNYNPNIINRTLTEMSTDDATNLFKSIDSETKCKMFETMDYDNFYKYYDSLKQDEFVSVIQNMDNIVYNRLIKRLGDINNRNSINIIENIRNRKKFDNSPIVSENINVKNKLDVIDKDVDIRLNNPVINRDISEFTDYGDIRYTEIYKKYGGFYSDPDNIEVLNDFYLKNKSVMEYLQSDDCSDEFKDMFRNFTETTVAGRAIKDLNFDEFNSCSIYSGESYRTINDSLRNGTYRENEWILKNINNIDSAFTKQIPLFEDIILYRDIKSSVFDTLCDGNIKKLEGQIFTDPGYMSTSLNRGFGETKNMDTTIKIKTPKGSKTLNMMAINMNPETEIILSRNSRLYIESVTENIIDGKKHYDIIASLIDDGTSIKEESLLSNFGFRKKAVFEENHVVRRNLPITESQLNRVNVINESIAGGKPCVVTVNSSSELSSSMFELIDDLSKVEFRILDGLGDGAGNLKSKYLYNDSYLDRVTYNGYEAKHIIEKLEYFQSKIDMNLSIADRARQVYDLLASEVPVMTDHYRYADGHKVSASLRGITAYNSTGKEGLVCAGFSSVYKELCERVGIKCDYVRGTALADPLNPGARNGHAWNVVYTEHGIVPVDVTWNACSKDSAQWFGTSYEFIQRHIADADEALQDYSNVLPNAYFYDKDDKIKYIFETMDIKFGGRAHAIKQLEKYVETGNLDYITRDNGVRDCVRSLDLQDINNLIKPSDINDKLFYVVNTIIDKYGHLQGPEIGIKALKEYVKTGNLDCITRTNGARDMISTIDMSDIRRFIEEVSK